MLLLGLSYSAAVFGADGEGAPTGDRLQQLQNAIIAAEESCQDPTAEAYRTNLPMAALQLKKAALSAASTWQATANGAGTYVDRGMEAIGRIEKGERYNAEPGKLSELAYFAQCDGTVQPYYVHLPTSYDANRPWPLIVFLHGYVPSITVLAPWVLSEDICQIA